MAGCPIPMAGSTCSDRPSKTERKDAFCPYERKAFFVYNSKHKVFFRLNMTQGMK